MKFFYKTLNNTQEKDNSHFIKQSIEFNEDFTWKKTRSSLILQGILICLFLKLSSGWMIQIYGVMNLRSGLKYIALKSANRLNFCS
jgi:hypothetical protein